jgi:hypothetical protein
MEVSLRLAPGLLAQAKLKGMNAAVRELLHMVDPKTRARQPVARLAALIREDVDYA